MTLTEKHIECAHVCARLVCGGRVATRLPRRSFDRQSARGGAGVWLKGSARRRVRSVAGRRAGDLQTGYHKTPFHFSPAPFVFFVLDRTTRDAPAGRDCTGATPPPSRGRSRLNLSLREGSMARTRAGRRRPGRGAQTGRRPAGSPPGNRADLRLGHRGEMEPFGLKRYRPDSC